ncbi:hypothetical protein PsorP6_004392 [Peronosclerospora sorghi]|uniref:Uncharacterized protein n=1 Tax=Peronosclerospora sorghi TaxID=230839 RepID=A0ACC0VNZ8_9STRA|nr:hypothetical protein PsorP6_004392 [Peronosclerospora sorghi]
MTVATPTCSFLDHSADCFTASWDLIWDQVRYWLLIQVPILAISILFEWLEVSSLKYVARCRKLCDAPLVNVVVRDRFQVAFSYTCIWTHSCNDKNYLVQIVTSCYVCIYWRKTCLKAIHGGLLVIRGSTLSVRFSSWSIESLFLIATGVGYGVRWLAAKNKVTFVLELHNLFDLLSMVAHFALSFQTTLVHNHRVRSWLDFGFLRSYVGYVVVTHLFRRYPHKTFLSQALLVIFKALFLVFFFAAVQFSLEQLGEVPHTSSFLLHVYKCSTPDGTKTILRATKDGTPEYPTCVETWSFFSSIYFMFVTVSTVGYGDFSPHTVLGQLTVCLIIGVGIYTFANESAAFVTLYRDERGTLVKYKSNKDTAHVIVTGNPSVAQMKDFIREFFHPDHDEALQGDERDREQEQDEPSASETSGATRATRYSSVYEAYAVMEEARGQKSSSLRPLYQYFATWRRRGTRSILETHLVVLLPFEKNAAYQHEVLAFVAQSPRYHKRVFLVRGSPLCALDLTNAQLERALAVFVLPNKDADDAKKQDAATVLRVLAVAQQKQAHTQLFAMLANSENRTLLEATGLDQDHIVCADEMRWGLLGLSCRCPGLSTVIANLITSRSDDVRPLDATTGWLDEYVAGAANEIYSCCLAPRFHGLTFLQATRQIHRYSNGCVLLIAIEAERAIVFNPGPWLRITGSTRAYLIAPTLSALHPFAGTPILNAIAALFVHTSMQPCRQHLIHRAHRAQANVARRIPHAIRATIDRYAIEPEPPSLPPTHVLAKGGHIIVCSNMRSDPRATDTSSPRAKRLVAVIALPIYPKLVASEGQESCIHAGNRPTHKRVVHNLRDHDKPFQDAWIVASSV